MKIVWPIILISLIVGFNSCHSGFRNFNKQKFTNLKKIEQPSDIIEKDNIDASEEKVLNSSYPIFEGVQIEVIPYLATAVYVPLGLDPTEEKIISAIMQGHEVRVVINRQTYVLNQPNYDAETKALSGSLVKIEKDAKAENPILILNVSSYDIIEGANVQIRRSEIGRAYTHTESDSTPLLFETGGKLSGSFSEWKNRETRFDNGGVTDNIHFKASRNFFLLALLWLVIGGIGIFVLAVSFAIGPLFLSVSVLVIGALMMLLALIIGFTLFARAAIAMKRYKNVLDTNEIEMTESPKYLRMLIVLGWMLFGSVPFLIPFFWVLWYWRKRAKTPGRYES